MAFWRIAAAGAAIGLVAVYALGSGRSVAPGPSSYQSLEQPAWQPPGAVFGLAWTYNFIALAVVGVAMSLGAPAGRAAAVLVALRVTIVLAIGWAYLFYVPHALVPAAVALTACALLTLVSLVLAFAERPWLGWVLLPYQAWLVVAASLSWGYVALSR
jgi:tryptophan-rich sensory protein